MRCDRCEEPRCATCEEGAPYSRDLKEVADDPVYRVASEIEVEGYMEWTRVEEIAELAERMGWKNIGVAYCVGLHEEASALCTFLEERGFDVVSVCCKVGGISKEELGLPSMGPDDLACNPAGQARVLNEEGTDLNVTVGLCVGHDLVFQELSDVPVITAVVKDRRLAHCPAAALTNRYYRRKLGID